MLVFGCAIEQRDETLAGVTFPVPAGMRKVANRNVEVSLSGFGGGQITFRGTVDPGDIVEFYNKEMPARGWNRNVSLVSGGGLLAYTKDSQSVLFAIASDTGATILTVTIGTKGK